MIPADSPLALATTEAIQSGNVEQLRQLLAEHPALATARLGSGPGEGHNPGMSRSLLHVATDWPGHFPSVAAVVNLLVAAGADVNARFTGPHTETPLHWAASSDDVEALDALLDAGADIEAPGAVIGGGTPLADATAFAQWRAAARLIERGARSNLWESASLGLIDRVEARFAGGRPGPDEITQAFWCACHGGQRTTAEYLLAQGADLKWVGYDDLTPLDAARRSQAADLVDWLLERGATSAG
jgi:ankyrin repeat protein